MPVPYQRSFWPTDEGGDNGITQLTGDVTAGPGDGSQVATISARAVTFAKLQAISTSRVLGRLTAGSGDVEELTITGSGNVVFSASPTLTGTALAEALTMSGRLINSVNGALSAPAVSFTGTPVVGGTGATTKPLVLFETAGATSTGWSTGGTMLGVNAPSGFAGNILDVQLNGSTRLSVSSGGTLTTGGSIVSGNNITSGNNVSLPSAGTLNWNSDTILVRDGAANTLALRNSTTAQTVRVYNTYTDASNYERGVLDWATSANNLIIGTQKAGTGSTRSVLLQVGSATTVTFGPATTVFSTVPVLPTYTVAGAPTASSYTRGLIYVSDESGGAVPAFSDGTNWRRVTDRAIIS